MKGKDWAILLAVAGGLYLAYRAFEGVRKAADKVLSLPGQFGSAVGLTLYEWLHDDPANLTSSVYKVTFPDGTWKSVDAATINKAGLFTVQGATWKLMRDNIGRTYAVKP